MYRNPQEFTVQSDREGFFLVDEFDEEVEPTRRHSSMDSARERIAHFIDNDEPPDPPGWEGGFAANH